MSLSKLNRGKTKTHGHSDTLSTCVFLYMMAGGQSYRNVGNVFGIPRNTVCRIFHKEVDRIAEIYKDYVKLPGPEGNEEIRRAFQSKSDNGVFDVMAGAIDGTHIPILAPAKNPDDYYNRKQYHSFQC